MSINSEIERITQNVANTYAVLSALGAELPEEQTSDNLAATAGTAKAVLYSEQTLDDTQKAQARENIGAGTSDFSGSYNDLTNKPSSFTPATHTQAASTITAGTFAGQVVANSSGQATGSYVLRNTKISASEESPTVNGQICWVRG